MGRSAAKNGFDEQNIISTFIPAVEVEDVRVSSSDIELDDEDDLPF